MRQKRRSWKIEPNDRTHSHSLLLSVFQGFEPETCRIQTPNGWMRARARVFGSKRTKNGKSWLEMETHNDEDCGAIRTSLRGKYCPHCVPVLGSRVCLFAHTHPKNEKFIYKTQ